MNRTAIFVACAGRQDGGPETYERHLVQAIAAVDRRNEYDVYCFSESARTALSIDQQNFRVHTLWPSSRWLSLPLCLPLRLASSGADLYHATFVAPPYSMTPCVFTMHDVSPFVRPEYYPAQIGQRLKFLVRRGLENARLVVCISEHCRQTTAEWFKLPLEKLVVVRHGVNPVMRPVPGDEARAAVQQAYGIDRPFVLYLGKLERRKNIVRLLRAFRRMLDDSGADVDLVLAGRRFWDTGPIDEEIDALRLRDRVIETGYVPDEIVPALYSAARMFVFPSLWEGFGLPVLEAMACGTPVITSNVSSLPEVAGDAAILVDPTSEDELSHEMTRVLEDDALRNDLRQRGLRRAAEFTWEQTARQTLEAYERARSN
jgi:glycosyltransferase involved in cell wall biosynthesis